MMHLADAYYRKEVDSKDITARSMITMRSIDYPGSNQTIEDLNVIIGLTNLQAPASSLP